MNSGLPKNAKCHQCGYALRDLPEHRCPECGEVFDPGDPDTYTTAPRAWAKLRRYWEKPPPVIWVAFVVLYAGLVLVVMSDPGISALIPWPGSVMQVACWLFPVLLYVLVDYLLRLALRNRRGGRETSRPSWRWAGLPVAVLLFLSALVTAWPQQLRFALSRPALESTVAEVRNTGRVPTTPTEIGMYHVTDVYADPNEVCFVIGETFGKGGIQIGRVLVHREDTPANRREERLSERWTLDTRYKRPNDPAWVESLNP